MQRFPLERKIFSKSVCHVEYNFICEHLLDFKCRNKMLVFDDSVVKQKSFNPNVEGFWDCKINWNDIMILPDKTCKSVMIYI